ncbi:MAG: hypothetical protein ACOYL1_06475, partial [Chlamydiia bacterium]
KNRLVDHLTELLTDGNPSFKTIPLPSSELKKIEKLAPENRTTIETDFNRTPIITLNKKLLYTNTKELDCGAERLAIMKAKIKDQAEGIEEREAYIGEICTQTGATYTLEQLMKKLFHLPDSPDQLSIPVRLSIVPAPRGIYNEVDFNTQSKEVVRHDYYEITLPSDKGNMDTIFGAIAITAIPFDPEKPGSIKYRFLPLKEFRDIASPSMLEKRKKGLLHRPYPISTLSSIAEDD